jgi:acylaminoacyl-peptidase
VQVLAEDLGGTAMTRPYTGGAFHVAGSTIAYTRSSPDRPAEIAVIRGRSSETLTALNGDLLPHRHLAKVTTVRFPSSLDGREIEAWIATPPGFEPGGSYPLILEIHGGPFAAYGPHFASEVQLYAAAGYVVVYVNPRGSTSYGAEFANLIHHAYPGGDFDDLMSAVDYAIEEGYADEERLFVTGGSGGGILTAWIVSHTDRFTAAVSAKPVINWYSMVLTADMAEFFRRYWFANPPWENPEAYLVRSPLHFVANVTTPTMLLTGEDDLRTPISESEQFYQALKALKVDTALVRVPEASHGIASRPSHLIGKVAHVLAWFERYDPSSEKNDSSEDNS